MPRVLWYTLGNPRSMFPAHSPHITPQWLVHSSLHWRARSERTPPSLLGKNNVNHTITGAVDMITYAQESMCPQCAHIPR